MQSLVQLGLSPGPPCVTLDGVERVGLPLKHNGVSVAWQVRVHAAGGEGEGGEGPSCKGTQLTIQQYHMYWLGAVWHSIIITSWQDCIAALQENNLLPQAEQTKISSFSAVL